MLIRSMRLFETNWMQIRRPVKLVLNLNRNRQDLTKSNKLQNDINITVQSIAYFHFISQSIISFVQNNLQSINQSNRLSALKFQPISDYSLSKFHAHFFFVIIVLHFLIISKIKKCDSAEQTRNIHNLFPILIDRFQPSSYSMSNQYQMPLGLCQWCYKTNGRFIVDCLCLVCQHCFSEKKDWVDENGKCFNCDKKTSRRCIDLKHNQQQAGLYFGNIGHTIQNFQRLNQFQQQVARKYCRHLQSKVSKLQTIIRSFISQFPQYRQFFENSLRQARQKQNQKVYRSKSAQMEIPQNYAPKIPIQKINTERNLPNLPMKNQQFHRVNNDNDQNQMYQPNQKNKNFTHQQKKEKNYTSGSKASSFASMGSNFSGIYPNHNPQVKKYPQENQQNFDSIPKGKVRKDPSKMMINPVKVPIQAYGEMSQNQIYVIGGSKKVSDQRKQQPIKLNNAVNIQTAIRSIRSDDERGFESNQKFRQINNYQNQQSHQFMNQQNANYGDNYDDEENMFKKFGRKSK